MFCFTRIDRQIFRPSVFADDHSFVNILLWADEKPAALLNIVERVSRAYSQFHRHHHTTAASSDFAFEWRVFAKEMTHQSFPTGQVHEIGLKANQATSRNNRLDRHACRVMIHANNLTLAISNQLQNVTEIFFRSIYIKIFQWLKHRAILRSMENHLRP